MEKFDFIYNKKKISVNVIVCDNVITHSTGIMFKKKSKPMLFVFKRPVGEAIHSFFCVPFISIWFLNGRIIDIKHVKPWRLHVKPDKKFDKFLEIPVGNKEYDYFLRRMRKI
jgi:uncharacterized membrane protein (UPF0127 family)